MSVSDRFVLLQQAMHTETPQGGQFKALLVVSAAQHTIEMSMRSGLSMFLTCYWETSRFLLCFLLFQTVFLSVFMFHLLRSVSLRAFSMASETYSPGTHSAAFVTCPNDTVAKDLAR